MPVEYKPGEKVPESGIYIVAHDPNHAARHEVTCVRGEPFLPCRGCGSKVRFTLSQAAMHTSEHQHFK
jgi:hypothetical protein